MTTQVNFSWIDYLVLSGLLCINVALGIYYGCFGTKQKSTKEYLHGGKTLKAFPVAMSLTASYVSGITLLGVPSDVYFYGTQYMMCALTVVLLVLANYYVFLPVYFKLQLPSSFEYFKLRFGHSTRSLASCLYILSSITHIPIVIYIPSLALNHVTGISVHIISPIICLVCIFYTTLGGLKAVVMSDAIQYTITMFMMGAVFVMGVYLSGGFIAIWKKAESTDRIEFFNMSLDPTIRQTFWGITVGMGVTFIGNMGISPSSIQRFLSLPTYEESKRALFMFGIGSLITKTLSGFTGLIMFARYIDCDPLSAGVIEHPDQLLPYYVLDAMGGWKGFPGLFVASLLCTALSSMSTTINTLSLTIYEDFLRSKLPKTLSQSNLNIILKSLVITTGILSLVMIFLIEKLGGVLQIANSFHGLALGPLVGLTTLGMIFPYANEKGAVTGGICSVLLTGFILGGTQFYKIQGRIPTNYKPLSTAGCDVLNDTLLEATTLTLESVSEPPPSIFLVSFYLYSLIGMTTVIIIGLPVSWLTKTKDEARVDRNLLSPCIYRLLSDVSKPDTDVELKCVEKPLIQEEVSKVQSFM